ncbi:MAG: NifB/NifX family molybdenum-iron cluster-binding protein [Thermodesulfobacteriota bacterium]
MKIAIATDGNLVSPHFGRCPQFILVEIQNGEIVKKEILKNPGHEPGFLPQFLHEHGVECIICGGMGHRAQGLFAEKGIQTLTGIIDEIDNVIERFLKSELKSGESLCRPGAGRDYGKEKSECDHHRKHHE